MRDPAGVAGSNIFVRNAHGEARDIGFPLDSTNQLCCWFGKFEAKLKPAPVGVAD